MNSIANQLVSLRGAWRRIASCAGLALTLVACGDNLAEPAPDAEPPPSSDAMPGGPDAAPGDSAYLVVSRVVNPDGRNVYLSVLPSLEPTTLDLSQALEVSGLSRAFTHDGAIFAMDGETGQIARYEVDEQLRISEKGRFSMANLGITGFSSAFAFISPTRAYYVDVTNLQVVVWNPEAMEISGTFSIADLAREDLIISAATPQVGGDRVIVPIGWSNLAQGAFHPAVGLLVLDAQANELIAILEDNRCAVGGGGFFDDQGDFYVIGDTSDGVYEAFGPAAVPKACLLRLPAGASEFDSEFIERLSDLAENPFFSGLNGTPDRTLLTRGFAPDVDLSMLSNPSEYFGLKAWLWQLIELDAGTRTGIELPPHVLSFGPFSVDDAFFLPQFDADSQQTVLYRLSDTQPVESITSPGEVQNIEKIR